MSASGSRVSASGVRVGVSRVSVRVIKSESEEE